MKFNTPTNTKTINRAGGEAYEQTPKTAFASLLLTSFVKDQYYRSGKDTLKEVGQLMDKISDKKFAAKAAVFARNEFGMRSISHAVAGNIASKVKGEQWTKSFFDKIVHRPDDMTEILAYYYSLGNKNEPNALKKGFAKALGRFDEYQLAKYKKDGAEVSLIDVANLVHPTNTEAIRKLITGTLPVPKTWETQISAAGKAEDVDEAKKEAWAGLIKERKLGYFALLRNLRNIVEQSPEIVPEATAMLTDEKLIKKSLVLPFRFMTAIRQLEEDGINNKAVFIALNQALEISFKNVPSFDGKTLVVVDHSGSMDSVEHGNMSNFEIGALFGVALTKSNDADFMYFGDDAKYYAINPTDSTATLVKILNGLNGGGWGIYSASSTAVGHGTNFQAIFDTANKAYDRIVIFSDMQAWVGYNAPTRQLADYKKRTNSNPHIYTIDLTGYGSAQFPESNIYALAGFSDKIFDIMKLLEQDRNALIKKIEEVEL